MEYDICDNYLYTHMRIYSNVTIASIRGDTHHNHGDLNIYNTFQLRVYSLCVYCIYICSPSESQRLYRMEADCVLINWNANPPVETAADERIRGKTTRTTFELELNWTELSRPAVAQRWTLCAPHGDRVREGECYVLVEVLEVVQGVRVCVRCVQVKYIILCGLSVYILALSWRVIAEKHIAWSSSLFSYRIAQSYYILFRYFREFHPALVYIIASCV